jgi:predicted nuclease of predicted toxin-antitoxin system
VKLLACKLLTDENIHPLVVQFLRQQGCDIEDVLTSGLGQAADDRILSEALKDNRIVLTHDRDFGRLAILLKQPIHGIIFLRPGHIDPKFTIASLEAIDGRSLDFSPSFILVARRRGPHLQLRMRRW